MRVVVVGRRSPIASAIRAGLRADGATVLTAARRGGDIALDLLAPPDVLRDAHGIVRADAVVNVAASTDGDAATSRRLNVDGARAVAELAARAGARRLVHISTAYAGYPERYPGPALYPESKAAGERVLADIELPATIVRLTHVYDAEGACRPHQDLPYHFAETAAAGGEIRLRGSGTARRDYLHLDDAAAAVALAVAGAADGTVTIGSPRMHSLAEVATTAIRVFGNGTVVAAGDGRDPPSMPDPGDSGWIALGGRPRVDLAAGLARMRRAMLP